MYLVVFAEPYLFADFRQHSDQLSLSEESLALFGILLLELDTGSIDSASSDNSSSSEA